MSGFLHITYPLHPVIARHEAIPKRQRDYANPPCTVGDCFVPRNDEWENMVLKIHINQPANLLAAPVGISNNQHSFFKQRHPFPVIFKSIK